MYYTILITILRDVSCYYFYFIDDKTKKYGNRVSRPQSRSGGYSGFVSRCLVPELPYVINAVYETVESGQPLTNIWGRGES